MPQKPNLRSSPDQAHPRGPAAARGKGRRIVRTIARSTLFAAGLAVTQFGVAEIDPRYQLFDRTLVDRLQAPITRFHE